MLTERQKQQIKADLLMTAIQSVQYVGQGNIFQKSVSVQYNINLLKAQHEVNAIIRQIEESWFEEYRILKDRPAELDDSEFATWLTEEWHNRCLRPKDFEVEHLAEILFGSIEDAVSEYRNMSAGDPMDD